MADAGIGEVSAAAVALAASPSDLGAWLSLARTLADAGESSLAKRAHLALGTAASSLGSVALAAACVRWLEANGDPTSAGALRDALAITHGRGSAQIDKTLRRPPVPPPDESTERANPPSSRDDIITTAKRAIDAAEESAEKRAPKKLAPTSLVGVLEPADISELISVMEPRWYERGDVVVDVGQPADTLYWIARGSVHVTRGDHALGDLSGNAFFGEIALLAGTSRTARVTCTQPCWLLELPAAAVERMASKAPRLARVLANYARARLLSNVMKTSELFSRLSEDERRELLPKFETKFFEKGEVVVSRGVENACLYVVASGSCEVRDDEGAIATLSVGDGVGEMSLLKRQPATADVVALDSAVLLCLEREQFDTVAVNHPGLLAEVYKLLVTREKENREAIVHDASELII